MKKVIGFLSIILVIFLLIYFLGPNLLPRLTRDLPFPTRGDQVKVEIKRLDISPDMTITNSSKIRVRVYAYDAKDWVRGIARAGSGWVLNPGQSASYPRDNYHFKVVIPKDISIFEPVLAKSEGVIGSDVVITGDQKNIKISGQPKKNVTFTNRTNEILKICAFNPGDALHIIPSTPCWSIGEDRTVEWEKAPRMFTIKVFRPQLLDKPLATESNVLDQSDIVIRSRGIWDRIKDLFS